MKNFLSESPISSFR